MDQNDTLFDKIEDYLRGKLSPTDAAAFERDMAADPKLAEQVALHRFEQDSLEHLLEDDLREKMKDWKNQSRPAPRARRWWWWLGGLLAVLVVFYLLYRPVEYYPAQPEQKQPAEHPVPPAAQEQPIAEEEQAPAPTPPQPGGQIRQTERRYLALAETAYSLPDQLTDALKSGPATPQTTDALSTGIAAFGAKDYTLAIRELRKISALDNPQQYEQASEWLAHAYFNARQYPQAAAVFQAIVSRNAGDASRERAEWYLALSLLTDYRRHKKQVDALLYKMADPDEFHAYEEDAKKMLAQLK